MGLTAPVMRGFRRRNDWTAVPWREVRFMALDLETTGLDLKRDSLVSYGAVPIEGGRVLTSRSSYGLVRPESPISPESIAVHTLRRTDLAGAPSTGAAVAHLDDLMTGRVLVAHAAWIECGFLTRAFKQHGAVFSPPVIDTAALARAAGLAPHSSRAEPSLEWLSTALGLPVVDPHNALGDAITTAQIFLAVASRLERNGYRTARALIDLTSGDAQFSIR